MNILTIHGVNLNLLGKREKSIYGHVDLEFINNLIKDTAKDLGFNIKIFQSNYEGKIVEIIQENADWADFLIINPGAYTHTSIAIRDAILGVDIKAIEVHISNIFKRETFRHRSYISDIAMGVISGFGYYGYIMALYFIKNESSN